jgi:hypothetical protein
MMMMMMMVQLVILVSGLTDKEELTYNNKRASALPPLNQVASGSLAAPYSCKGSNYSTSALFLSTYSKTSNDPDLLYNSYPGGTPDYTYFEAALAGDDFAVIADVGVNDIINATSHKAFNWKNVVGSDNTFKQDALVVVGHLYAVLISKSDVRALYWLKVTSVAPGCGSIEFDYAVRQYELISVVKASPGFDLEKPNAPKPLA